MKIKSLTVTHTKFVFLYKCTRALSHMPMCHVRVDSVVCNQQISCVNIVGEYMHWLTTDCIIIALQAMYHIWGAICVKIVLFIYIVVVCRVVEHQHRWHMKKKQRNSVWNLFSLSFVPRLRPCQVIGYDAAVHLQISTDYLRESCMTILQVTCRQQQSTSRQHNRSKCLIDT